MTWTKICDTFCFHPKIVRAGNGAAGAFVRMLSYANCHLTDGLIDEAMARQIAGDRRTLSLLVECRLLEPEEGSFRIHDFHDYNARSSEVREKRDLDKARKRASRRAGPQREEPDSASDEPDGFQSDSYEDGDADSVRSSPVPIPIPDPIPEPSKGPTRAPRVLNSARARSTRAGSSAVEYVDIYGKRRRETISLRDQGIAKAYADGLSAALTHIAPVRFDYLHRLALQNVISAHARDPVTGSSLRGDELLRWVKEKATRFVELTEDGGRYTCNWAPHKFGDWLNGGCADWREFNPPARDRRTMGMTPGEVARAYKDSA
jgi:hypothetical protein